MVRKPAEEQTICTNRKAGHRFELLDRLECGIVLVGTEVKSLRTQSATLEEAFARIDGGELWLVDFHIGAYRHGPVDRHEAARRRKLLVHGRELRKLQPKVTQKGLTLVPVRVYFNDRGLVKVTVALARGKSVHDKRETLRTRDHKREMERATRLGKKRGMV